MADLERERADFKPERADLRPERADLRPERADLRLERAYLGPEPFAQGQYVVSDTICPALHDCEFE